MRASLLCRAVLAAALAGPLAPTTAGAQAYPGKLVKLVVPYVAGGNSDSVARVIADALARALNGQFVVENKPGAGGAIATESVAKAPADGYTLLLATPPQLAILPHIQKVAYDALKDFSPISNLGTNAFALGVHRSTGARTLKELIELARAQPGRLTYAGSNASIAQLSGAMLASRAGVDMVHVPYKGGPAAMVALVAGEVQMYLGNFSDIVPYAKSGRIVMLAVSSEKRHKDFPDVPAIAETFPGFRTLTWNGLVAPAATPRDIIERLSAESQKAMKDPAVIRRLEVMGVEAYGSTPADFADTIRNDFETYRDVVKAIGLKLG
jgi:tripartite-type tricarboxylate transporter receptor subunit TctC